MTEDNVTPIELPMWICGNGHRWKARQKLDECYDDECDSEEVSEWKPDWIDFPEDFVEVFASAMAKEMGFFKANPETWIKAAKGVLTKTVRAFTEQPYDPRNVTAEEVQVIDLVLLSAGASPSDLSRVEQINAIIDYAGFWKQISKDLGGALEAIRDTKGLNETQRMRDIASEALSNAAADIGG